MGEIVLKFTGEVDQDAVVEAYTSFITNNTIKSIYISRDESEAKAASQNTVVNNKPVDTKPAATPSDNIKQASVSMLREGKSVADVMAATGLSRGTVAAYKAHITMGTYK